MILLAFTFSRPSRKYGEPAPAASPLAAVASSAVAPQYSHALTSLILIPNSARPTRRSFILLGRQPQQHAVADIIIPVKAVL